MAKDTSYITKVTVEYSDGDQVALLFEDGAANEGFTDFAQAHHDTIWGGSALRLFARILDLVLTTNREDL